MGNSISPYIGSIDVNYSGNVVLKAELNSIHSEFTGITLLNLRINQESYN